METLTQHWLAAKVALPIWRVVWRECSWQPLRSRVRAVAADRRGVTALLFAGLALAIMGFVSLATEGGLWYLIRRNAQNAADAAALAGALASYSGAGSTASALAISNGFPGGATTTGSGTVADPLKVTVSQTVAPLLSSLFGVTSMSIGATAAAAVEPVSNACVLSLTGDLTVSGSSATGKASCGFASNSFSDTSVNVTGKLSTSSVTAAGGWCCIVGGASTISSTRPPAPYHPVTTFSPTISPTSVSPPATCAAVPTPQIVNGASRIDLSPYELTGTAYCNGDLMVPVGTTLCVPSGTYFFNNASLTILGTATYTSAPCQNLSAGSSFVFTGTPPSPGVGSYVLYIDSAATVTLSAFKTLPGASTPPGLAGFLFYGRGLNPVSISIGSPSGQQTINGSVYFPSALLSFSGNSGNGSKCLSLVAATVQIASSINNFQVTASSSTLCKNSYGTTLPTTWAARLVQ